MQHLRKGSKKSTLWERTGGLQLENCDFFITTLSNQAVKQDLHHANSKDYNQLKAFITYRGHCIWTTGLAAWTKFCTDWKKIDKKAEKNASSKVQVAN